MSNYELIQVRIAAALRALEAAAALRAFKESSK